MTYQEVKQACIERGYVWFKGKMDPNLVFFRNSDQYTNKYTDTLAICWIDENNSEQIYQCRVSTKPALYGQGSVTNPNVIDGLKAVGVIAEGQHLRAWKMTNFNRLTEGVKCFVGNPHLAPSLHQIGHFTIYRDGDLDKTIDTDIVRGSDWQGFNFHYGSIEEQELSYQNGYLPWSTGCFTTSPQLMYTICTLLSTFIPYTGEVISPTVIKNY